MVHIMKITKRKIDYYIIESLFSFEGYTDNEETALKKAIADCKAKGEEYSMSAYVKKIWKGMANNENLS